MRKANVYLTSQFFNKVKQGFTVGFGGRYIVIMGPIHSYKGAASSSGSGNKPRPLRGGGGGRAICGDPGIQKLFTINIYTSQLLA